MVKRNAALELYCLPGDVVYRVSPGDYHVHKYTCTHLIVNSVQDYVLYGFEPESKNDKSQWLNSSLIQDEIELKRRWFHTKSEAEETALFCLEKKEDEEGVITNGNYYSGY